MLTPSVVSNEKATKYLQVCWAKLLAWLVFVVRQHARVSRCVQGRGQVGLRTMHMMKPHELVPVTPKQQ